MEPKQNSFKQLFCINLISMYKQFKPFIFYLVFLY